MPLSISTVQNELLRVLTDVIRAVETRPSLPILSCVLMEAENDVLKVTASNLGLSITATTSCLVDQPGRVALPAKTLHETIASFGNGSKVTLVEEDNFKVILRSGKSRAKIDGLNPAAFPDMPTVEANANPSVTLAASVLSPALDRTLYACAASAEDRPMKEGLSFRFENQKLSLIGLDGYRMANQILELPEATAPFTFVIRAAALREVAKLFDAKSEVQVCIESSPNLVRFSTEGLSVLAMTLEGKYLLKNADKIIENLVVSATLDLDELKALIKQVRIFAQDMGYRSRMVLKNGMVQMTGQSQERGMIENEMDGEGEGELEIGININFLQETLNSLGTASTVKIASALPCSFIVLECEDIPGLIAGISPMGESHAAER